MKRLSVPALLVMLAGTSARAADIDLPRYETDHYILYTDLDEEGVREARLRLNLMVQLYQSKTEEFAGKLRGKLPFYLFTDRAEYVRVTGMPNSAGVYMRRGDDSRLMAYINPQNFASGWSTVQHEGFHQFVDQVIGGEIPLWANEGMAEYFEEVIFAGDRFVEGVVHWGRLRRLKRAIENRDYFPFEEFIQRTGKDWHQAMGHGQARGTQYLQAWSMVHFLAVSQNGKYQREFGRFIKAVAGGQPVEDAWGRSFRNTDRLEREWAQYWLAFPEELAIGTYIEANLAIMTNFLARAMAVGQEFDSPQDFFYKLEGGVTGQPASQWLPPRLGKEHAANARAIGEWVIRRERGYVELRVHTDGGWVGRGRFKIGRGQVRDLILQVEAKGAARRFERYR
jgi:hypothetical protein